MRLSRAFAISIRSLLTSAACVASSLAGAQSYSADGQIGYLQEWEMKGNLAKTMTRAGENYTGPVTLRHVGLCSANGIEEKSGLVQLRILSKNSGFDGTLALADDNCRISASGGQPYTGLLSCRNGQGIPIHFTIGPLINAPMQVSDRVPPQSEK